MTNLTVLAAGDHFVLPRLLTGAVRAEVGAGADIAELTLPWPDVPFGRVAEVEEASGTEEELIAALQSRRVLVTQLAPVTGRVLDACPDLELVAVCRGGPVNVNVEAASRHGVRVAYAPGRNAAATAELTVALILAVIRRLPALHGSLRGGTWRGEFFRYDECGIEVEDTTVGLVGYGAVGSRVASAIRALGGHVLVHDPYVDDDALAGVAERAATLEDLMGRARIVSLHARVTPETRGLVGRAALARLPEGSYLVNCARGGLLDYDAACDALASGRLAGAAFDVYAQEPPPAGHRLFQLARDGHNVITTPHVAGASRAVAEKAARIVAAEVARFAKGEELEHLANPEASASQR